MPERWRPVTKPDGTPLLWGDLTTLGISGRLADSGLSIRRVKVTKRILFAKLTVIVVWLGPASGLDGYLPPEWGAVLSGHWRGLYAPASKAVRWVPTPAGVALEGVTCLETVAERQRYMSKLAAALGLGGVG